MKAGRRSSQPGVQLSLDVALRGLSSANWSQEMARDLISRVLEATGLDYDQRIEVLGGAFVAEAVAPYWADGNSAPDAHALLRRRDDELADVVEALSPMLLGRAEAREQAVSAVDAVAALLSKSEPS